MHTRTDIYVEVARRALTPPPITISVGSHGRRRCNRNAPLDEDARAVMAAVMREVMATVSDSLWVSESASERARGWVSALSAAMSSSGERGHGPTTGPSSDWIYR
eukprot:GHVU01016736.1.p1 GENE.GHVU01016736.1~~GHVU01016736.1.p1  ORF type:complete len:105 (+),score=5.82 GHVU01016736.1:244-558(+)